MSEQVPYTDYERGAASERARIVTEERGYPPTYYGVRTDKPRFDTPDGRPLWASDTALDIATAALCDALDRDPQAVLDALGIPHDMPGKPIDRGAWMRAKGAADERARIQADLEGVVWTHYGGTAYLRKDDVLAIIAGDDSDE